MTSVSADKAGAPDNPFFFGKSCDEYRPDGQRRVRRAEFPEPAGKGSVIRPILFVAASVNHMFPSEAATIACGWLFAVGIANSVMTPAVVMAADLVARVFNEPEPTVGAEADAVRVAPCRRYRILGDGSARRDPADAVAPEVGEPESAVSADELPVFQGANDR